MKLLLFGSAHFVLSLARLSPQFRFCFIFVVHFFVLFSRLLSLCMIFEKKKNLNHFIIALSNREE